MENRNLNRKSSLGFLSKIPIAGYRYLLKQVLLIVDKSSKQCLSVECTWCWAHWEQQNNTTFRFSSPRLWCVGIALLSDIQCLENVT